MYLRILPGLELSEPTPEAVELIARNLREDDVEELKAYGIPRATPLSLLNECIKESDFAAVVSFHGEPVMVFGVKEVSTLMGSVASPWALGTDAIYKDKKLFMAGSLRVMGALKRTYPRMYNYVYAGSVRSIRWLKRIGFKVERVPEPYGRDGQLFHKFTYGE